MKNIKDGYSESFVETFMPGTCCFMDELHALTSCDMLEHPQEINSHIE